jgi:exopolysaccharide biosynthesis polyprenyl glycosylphosphotransferase
LLWRPTYHRRIAQLADALTTAFSFVLAYAVWNWLRVNSRGALGSEIHLTSDLYLVAVGFSAVWVIVLAKMNAYTYQRFTSLQHEIVIVLKASLIGTLTIFAVIFGLRVGYVARTYVCIFFLSNAVCLVLQKAVMFRIAQKVRERGRNRKRVIVAGTGVAGYNFVKTTEANLGWGLDIVGVVALNGKERLEEFHGKPLLGDASAMEDILHNHQVDEVVICASAKELGHTEAVFDVCEREGVQVRLNSDFFGRLAKGVSVDNVYGLPIISFSAVPGNEWLLYTKRLIDIVGSLLCLAVLSPLFAIIAFLIKLTSPGPVFYRWNVIGFNKKPFASWKFRTMIVNADEMKEQLMRHNEMSGPVFKMKNDPRTTEIGRILRKYSLDELPQLWSVLKGDMSLVGPRPAGPRELIRYESWQRRKLSIKPGMTCLWQVSGRNRINDFNEWCLLDLQYIDNFSLWLDLKILFRTIVAVAKGTGC